MPIFLRFHPFFTQYFHIIPSYLHENSTFSHLICLLMLHLAFLHAFCLPPPFLTSLTKLSRVLATQNLQQHNFGEILNRWEMWEKSLASGKTLVHPGSQDRYERSGKADKCTQYRENIVLSPCLKFPKKERKLKITILTWTSLYRRRAWGYNPSYRHDPPWYASRSNWKL